MPAGIRSSEAILDIASDRPIADALMTDATAVHAPPIAETAPLGEL
jgi:hypothetical protein